MTEQHALRRRSLLTAGLAATLLTPVLTAAPARAQPPVYGFRAHRWDVTDIVGLTHPGLAANAFRHFLDDIHRSIGTPTPVANVRHTEPIGNNLIEIQVIDRNQSHQHRLTLYLWADNLYLIGIRAQPDRNRPSRFYAFRDMVANGDARRARDILRHVFNDPNVEFQSLAFGSRYSGSGQLDPGERRQNLGLTIQSMAAAIAVLTGLSSTNDVPAVRDAFIRIIAATSESFRFGWMARRIETIMRYGSILEDNGMYSSTLGEYGVELQRDWAALSLWAANSTRGADPSWFYVDATRGYRNVPHALSGSGDRNLDRLMLNGYSWHG
ncbi:hypothetical protein GCM10010387_36510 [Streptomyces inusitatus]|uniref:rRNA N-glycosylase n=1 Tax=Streptomyces inusitatus TaxID=68221 RepID=A0A918QBT4_9ACTN|nr:ribosome-inactivating family protein [Streptomyces inusitatus]GGZ39118.1 hypothetical protein GCM10010387_36510 [Streptomyces inusitatus]